MDVFHRFIASTSYVLELRFIAVAAFGDTGLKFGKRKEDAPGHPVSSAPRFFATNVATESNDECRRRSRLLRTLS
jgi:hypothetical protein